MRLRRAIVLVVALALALMPLPGRVVERLYSTGLYLTFQPWVTGASNLTAASLLDILIVVAAVGWIVAVAVDLRHGWIRGGWRALTRTVTACAVAYLAFLVMWGLNYRRLPLADKLQFESARVTSQSADEAAQQAVRELNRLYAPAHAAGWTTPGLIDPGLAAAFVRVQQALGVARAAVPGRPKRTMLEAYFRRAGVSGMTDPYLLETLVDDTLLPFERPFVFAHEWAHLAGYADEGEANFVGWLVCLGGRDGDQYSGWLFLYEELAGATPRQRQAALAASLDEGVRSDLRAIGERLRTNINPTVAAAGWRAYDSYLKANRVEAGMQSYDTVVRLVLGTRFGAQWTPLLK